MRVPNSVPVASATRQRNAYTVPGKENSRIADAVSSGFLLIYQRPRKRGLDISKKTYIIKCMWRIEEHGRVDKQIDSLPNEILKRYEKWKDISKISGPSGLRLIKGFHDEALGGKWNGYRSSRLGLQYRVIYRIFPEALLFQIASISAHDYRRS